VSLKFVETKGLSNSGIGFKVARQVSEGVFIPYFYHFLKSGYGGVPPDVDPKQLAALNIALTRTQTIYRLHETTRVKADRFARSIRGAIYPAGIHFWFELEYARERFHVLRTLDSYNGSADPRLALVKFRWFHPVAFDDEIVVATAGIPLEIIPTHHSYEGSISDGEGE
jgi:hypothetical protein